MGTILLIILILALVGALLTWNHRFFFSDALSLEVT